ncbi:MAG: hypothetical protein PHH58_12750 [Rhodoferax sp.]|nr:hypothetical protein [Rhodoferax sp.]
MAVIAGYDPQSIARNSWMPDRVRHDRIAFSRQAWQLWVFA